MPTDTATKVPRHPAKWAAPILDVIVAACAGVIEAGPYLTGPVRVLDPFAGPSRGIHTLVDRYGDDRVDTIGVELEPEWAAAQAPRTVVGDALALPDHWSNTFDVVATSPCYGNRMADHHEARDACKTCGGSGCRVPGCLAAHPDDGQAHGACKTCKGEGLSRRNTYTHALGRKPTAGSGAVLLWHPGRAGDPYRRFHAEAWDQVARVLVSGGLFLLNVSNHMKLETEHRVVEWHLQHLLRLADDGRPVWRLDALVPVATRRQRQGANRDRVAQEFVIALRKN